MIQGLSNSVLNLWKINYWDRNVKGMAKKNCAKNTPQINTLGANATPGETKRLFQTGRAHAVRYFPVANTLLILYFFESL